MFLRFVNKHHHLPSNTSEDQARHQKLNGSMVIGCWDTWTLVGGMIGPAVPLVPGNSGLGFVVVFVVCLAGVFVVLLVYLFCSPPIAVDDFTVSKQRLLSQSQVIMLSAPWRGFFLLLFNREIIAYDTIVLVYANYQFSYRVCH